MEIFVTGGTGFIGENLIKRLLQDGHTIHAIYRSEKKKNDLNLPQVKWFKGDITSVESLEKAMEGCQQAYHIAGYAVAWEEAPGYFHKYNVEGTRNVLEAALKKNIQKIVFTSTAGVYGPSLNNKIITEETQSAVPYFTGYEASKAEAEKLIQDFIQTTGLPVVIVNPTRVFGPGSLSQSNSVTLMINQYLEGKWHFIPGNGKAIGNYVFIDDVVNGLVLAMEKGKGGEKYIFGGENVSYNQFFDTVQKISNQKYLLIHVPVFLMNFIASCLIGLNKIFPRFIPPLTPAHVKKYTYNFEISCDKAIRELGYSITPFEEAIRKTVNFYKK
jgi:nucleoside-diphosphate-sugar epimerase